jgi:outer membrane protein
MVSAALATYDAALQDAMSSVVKAYCDAVTARASLDAKTADEEIARRTLQSAKEREAKGAISQSDTLRATTALARASLDRSRAGGDYQKALAVLRYQMGVPGGTELLLPSQFQEHYRGELEKKELSLWLEEAQRNHPAIVAARKKVEASRQQVTVSKSAGLPFASFVANYYQNTRPGEAATPSGAREVTLTVGISVPLFDGFASTYKVRGAQAQVEKQSADMRDTEQQVAMGVIRAYSDANAAMQNLEASATLVESAKNALAVSQRKYEKGAADVTEVLSTQSALADAWNERIRCLAEWHSARLQLLASAGELGRSALTE